MKNITSNNLTRWAEEFDNAMQEYKKNYDRLSAEVKCYNDLNEFERRYLE